MQIWFIGRTLASQAGKGGSTPLICSIYGQSTTDRYFGFFLKGEKFMVKNIRVGIVGLGHISHRHMQIYKHINELAEKLGFRVEIAAVAEILP